MASIIKVNNIEIMIDIASYLQRYDVWTAAKWSDDKLICASPFRDDSHPSFFVNLENGFDGTWLDSGTDESGNFQMLIAGLDESSLEEACDKLLEEFYIKPYEVAPLMPNIGLKGSRTILKENTGNHSDYLLSRGVSREAQEAYGTFMEPAKGAVVFPYIDGNGMTRALKYRKVALKEFWYHSGTNRIKDLIFGHHLITELKPNTLWICEAEIDAMTVFSAGGYVAVSIGNASISEEQLNIIKKAGFKNVVTACDGDGVGNKTNNAIAKALKGSCNVMQVNYKGLKDINEYVTSYGELPDVHKVSSEKALTPHLRGI